MRQSSCLLYLWKAMALQSQIGNRIFPTWKPHDVDMNSCRLQWGRSNISMTKNADNSFFFRRWICWYKDIFFIILSWFPFSSAFLAFYANEKLEFVKKKNRQLRKLLWTSFQYFTILKITSAHLAHSFILTEPPV